MMPPFIAFLLSLLQGITEFFPISSSAHLKLLRLFFHIDTPNMLLFDLTCHLGTTLAAALFLAKEIRSLFIENRKQLFSILLALTPLIPIYLIIKPFYHTLTQSNIFTLLMCMNGFVLLFSSSHKPSCPSSIHLSSQLKDGLFIGLMQALALFPGLSRSGLTMSAAFFRGWDFTRAVRFSFLLAIPTIAGGEFLESMRLFSHGVENPFSLSILFLAFFTSLVVGFFSIRLLFKLQEKKKLQPFGWYCLTVGLFSFIYLNWF